MSKTKSQSSLEFLLTYGWAFLFMFIMVGALMYFGILNPSRLLPDKCLFASPLSCKSEELVISKSTTGTVRVKVLNDFGSSIYVLNAKITTDFESGCTGYNICFDDNNDNQCAGDPDLDAAIPISWPKDASKKIVVDCTNGGNLLSKGEKVRFTLSMDWYPSAGNLALAKPVIGQLFVSVQ